MRQLAQLEGAKDLLPDVFKEIEDRYDYTGKTDAELDKYRKRFDPYAQVLDPLEQQFALQGIAPQAGLQQMVAANQFLQQDPDRALMWLAQNFKPKDVKAFIQGFAQQFGVDISGLVQQQAWVDPEVKKLIGPLEEQNRQLMELFQRQTQQQQQAYQYQYQQSAMQIAEAIKGFKEATDENGNPKYPHYDLLEPRMTAILQRDGIKPLETLYEEALKELTPLIGDRAKAASVAALHDAERTTAATEKALKASRNVNGSGTSVRDVKPADLRSAIRRTHKRLSG
jgi:hypothetical protein